MDDTTTPLAYPAPPARPPRLSVEAEASLMNRGRSRQLWGLGAGALVLVVTVVVLTQALTRGDGYSSASTSILQVEREQFDAFFSCALPGTRISELSAARLTAAFTSQADRFGKGYASRLAGCATHIRALDTHVRTLKVPAAVEAQHQQLVVASSALASATASYSSYLGDPGREFDLAVAKPMIQKLAAAWAGYQNAQERLEQALERHR